MTPARRALSLLALATTLPLVACGDDASAGAPDAGVVVPADAAEPDATPPPPDAMPAPDARPADLSCAGAAPSTDPVPETIHLGAILQTNQGQALGPVADAPFEVRLRADDTVVAEGTTSALGLVDVAVPTSGAALDVYVSIHKDGLIPVNLFYAKPLVADAVGAQLLTLAPSLLTTITGFAGITLDAGEGMLVLRLEDCDQVGIVGAHVTVEGGDAGTMATDIGALSDMFAGGQLIINVPVAKDEAMQPMPTPVTLEAAVANGQLAATPVKVFADAFTYVVLKP